MRFFNVASVTVVMLLSACCSFLTAAENLLPPVKEAKGFWYQARNSEASVKYSCNEKAGSFHLESTTDTGYVNYRCDLNLQPGVYTVDLMASGSCDTRAIGLEVYSFNAQGKARLLAMSFFPEGKFSSERKVASLTVPKDSVKQRFGLCLNKKGRAEFVKPALYKGKLNAADLPPREGDKSATKRLKANHNTWVADWVWVKNVYSVSKASFIKKFTVDKPVIAAMVQLTADNGYELRVNDQFVGADGDWRTVEKYDIVSLLKKGENTIELIGENYDGVGAVLLQGQLWFNDGSSLDLLTGPDWDLYIKGKLANEQKVIIGKFPIEPWTLLPFERLAPMEALVLPVRKSVSEVTAGEIFTLKLGDAEKIPAKELSELRLVFTDERNMPAVVSQHTKPFVRREGKTLYMDLELSLYAKPGTYRWKIEGLTMEILASGIEQQLTVLPPAAIPGNPGTLLPRFDGKNTMQTGGGEMSLFTYATSLPDPQRFYNWQHTGGHMYEVSFSAGKMRADGTVDLSDTEQRMMQILSGDPNAGVYIRLRVDVPGWWNARNPDEVFVSDKGRRALQSFCSDKWMSDMQSAISKVVDGLAARPVGKALSGVLIMGFRGGEFQLWGEDVGEYDCSKPAQREFTKWQKARGYKDIITLPHPALTWPFRYQEGYAAVRERFFSFVADRHADNMITFAKFFKERYGNKYGFGLYYGYAQEHGGSWKRMLFGGHLGFRKVIENAPLDLLSCPASYGLRPAYRSHAFMFQPDSAALFGIRSIIENDIRPYAHPLPGDSSGTTIYSMADSLVNDSRLSLFAACHGSVVRYLALGEIVDWFGPLPSINQIRKDNLRNMQLEPAELGAAGQLAWAVDTSSWVKAADMKFTEKKWAEFASYGRDTVMRSGRSVAFLTVEDLINYPGKWKIVAIPAPALLPQEKIAALEKQYGKFPKMASDTGALIINNGKMILANTREELWQAIATAQAKAAGINTVWYVGGNFVGTWDGKALKVSKR